MSSKEPSKSLAGATAAFGATARKIRLRSRQRSSSTRARRSLDHSMLSNRRGIPTSLLAAPSNGAPNRNTGKALHGKGEKDQKRNRAGGAEVVANRLLKTLRLLVSFDAIDGAQGSDDDFPGGKRSDQADADL